MTERRPDGYTPPNSPDYSEEEVKRAFLDVEEYRRVYREYEDKIGGIVSRLRHTHDLSEDEKSEYFSQLQENQGVIRTAFGNRMVARLVITNLVDLAGVRDHEEETDNLETGQNKFMRFGLNTILDLQDDINRAMRDGRIESWSGLQAYNMLLIYGTENDQRAGVSAFAKNIDVIEKGLGHEKADSTYTSFIRDIFKFGSSEQAQSAAQSLERALSTADSKKIPLHISAFFAKCETIFPELQYRGWKAVRSALERFGLPDDVFVDAWLVSTKTEKMEDAVYNNLKVITELEESKSGSSLLLYKEFGIVDFGRYPTEMLLRQVEEIDGKSKPYGVVVYPRNDHNGAFYEDREAFEKFFENLRGEFSVRVVECEGKRDVAKALIRLNRRYNLPDGSGHKISLAIIGGHGTEDTIRFGGADERHVLRTQDLAGKGTTKAGQFFEENPTIILVSCSTGADKGIGQELSERLGAKVIAPKVPTNISELHASKRRGQSKFRFNAKFKVENEKNIFLQGEVAERR